MANLVVAQMLFLESENPDKDIHLYINSPGGSVTAGLSIYDKMQFIKPDVSTMCIGQAASMGAFLLAGLAVVVLTRGAWLLRSASRRRAALVALLILVLALLWPVGDPGWPVPGWRLAACDVGQGDALVVATQPGHALVVDAGPDPSVVDGCLRRLGVGEVACLVLTPCPADPANGVPGCADSRSVERGVHGSVAPVGRERHGRHRGVEGGGQGRMLAQQRTAGGGADDEAASLLADADGAGHLLQIDDGMVPRAPGPHR